MSTKRAREPLLPVYGWVFISNKDLPRRYHLTHSGDCHLRRLHPPSQWVDSTRRDSYPRPTFSGIRAITDPSRQDMNNLP